MGRFSRLLENFQDLQIRPQSQRLQILELLNDMMFQHRQALKDLGEEFIVGVTDLISGEKDPRNLMIIFSVLKVVMTEWDISNHAEVRRSKSGISHTLISPSLCSILSSAIFPSLFDHRQTTHMELLRRISKIACGLALQHQVCLRLLPFHSSSTSLTQPPLTSRFVPRLSTQDSSLTKCRKMSFRPLPLVRRSTVSPSCQITRSHFGIL